MPMTFPDMKSLLNAAEQWKFRKPLTVESEAEYRNTLADFVRPKDLIESQEIRTGRGWDQWSESDKRDLFKYRGFG